MKNDFRFVWDDNAEEVFRALQDGKAEDYLFSVRIGDLCFDLKADEDDSAEYPIDYDLYVGGAEHLVRKETKLVNQSLTTPERMV